MFSNTHWTTLCSIVEATARVLCSIMRTCNCWGFVVKYTTPVLEGCEPARMHAVTHPSSPVGEGAVVIVLNERVMAGLLNWRQYAPLTVSEAAMKLTEHL